MGKLVFNFKAVKLNKTAKATINKHLAEQENILTEEYLKIALTKFNVDYEYKERQRSYDIDGEEHCDTIKIPDTGSFILVSQRVIKDIQSLPSYESKLLAHIVCNLNWDSNVIQIDVNDCPEVSTSAKYVRLAIFKLVELNYIAKTVIPGVLVINHNEMFLGNKKKFIANYKKIHKDEEVTFDKQGRIIINGEKKKRGVING